MAMQGVLGSTYTIQKGNCLWNIVKARYGYKEGVDNALIWEKIREIQAYNNEQETDNKKDAHWKKITDPHWIYPEQVLTFKDGDRTKANNNNESLSLLNGEIKNSTETKDNQNKPGQKITKNIFQPFKPINGKDEIQAYVDKLKTDPRLSSLADRLDTSKNKFGISYEKDGEKIIIIDPKNPSKILNEIFCGKDGKISAREYDASTGKLKTDWKELTKQQNTLTNTESPEEKKKNKSNKIKTKNDGVNILKCLGIGALNLGLGFVGARMNKDGKVKADIKSAAITWGTIGALAGLAALGPIGIGVAAVAGVGLLGYSVVKNVQDWTKAKTSGAKEEALIDSTTVGLGIATAAFGPKLLGKTKLGKWLKIKNKESVKSDGIIEEPIDVPKGKFDGKGTVLKNLKNKGANAKLENGGNCTQTISFEKNSGNAELYSREYKNGELVKINYLKKDGKSIKHTVEAGSDEFNALAAKLDSKRTTIIETRPTVAEVQENSGATSRITETEPEVVIQPDPLIPTRKPIKLTVERLERDAIEITNPDKTQEWLVSRDNGTTELHVKLDSNGKKIRSTWYEEDGTTLNYEQNWLENSADIYESGVKVRTKKFNSSNFSDENLIGLTWYNKDGSIYAIGDYKTLTADFYENGKIVKTCKYESADFSKAPIDSTYYDENGHIIPKQPTVVENPQTGSSREMLSQEELDQLLRGIQ